MYSGSTRERSLQCSLCLSNIKLMIVLACLLVIIVILVIFFENSRMKESPYSSYIRNWIYHVTNSKKTLQRTKPFNGNSSARMMVTSNKDKSGGNRLHRVDNKESPLLTLFTSWTSTAEKYICHNNTVKNWLSFIPHVFPVLFSNESDLTLNVQKAVWKVLPVRQSINGIPILRGMFLDVMKQVSSQFYAYSNGNILFTNQLIETLRAILMSKNVNISNPTMIVGRRTNVMNVTREESSSWDNITKIAKTRGTLFLRDAEDFFITRKKYPWKDVPDLLIGRRAYDKWLVLSSRKHRFITIDITATSLAVHQTTKTRNFEGHHRNDTHYNHNLLIKLYKKVRYEAGLTTCTHKITKQDSSGHIIVENRKNYKSCFPL